LTPEYIADEDGAQQLHPPDLPRLNMPPLNRPETMITQAHIEFAEDKIIGKFIVRLMGELEA